jgi:uncharacterized caspase-like protein
MRVRAFLATIFVLFAAATLAVPAAEAQQATSNPRIALVIGNAAYGDAALATAANDAGLVAQTLQAAGFDVVGARDLDGQSLRSAFRDFLDKAAAAGPDMQAFVYLSGRAIQYNGDNYFVAVDAAINHDADVPIEAFRISDFSHALAALPGRARIIVIDGARANPYPAQGAALAPGLALVDPEAGELIAFNAAPGTLAGDEQGPYGVYAKTLAGAMRQGGVDISQVFDQTRVTVNDETQGALLPWNASKLEGPYFVFERAAEAPAPPPPPAAETAGSPIAGLSEAEAYAAAIQRDTIDGYREYLAAYPRSAQASRIRAILAVLREASFWRRTVSMDTPHAYWTYLRVYPRGPHVVDARRRLAFLSAAFAPPADFQPEVFEDLQPPPPDELFYQERPVYAFDDFGPPPPPPPAEYVYAQDDDWRYLPPPPPPVAIGVLPVLTVAVPIAAGAVAYHGWRPKGVAPPGATRLAPPPLAPPPLPANVKPPAPRPPVTPARAPANMMLVKPLPPIAPPATGPATPGAVGAKPPAAPTAAKPLRAPQTPAGGAPPAAAPAGPAGAKSPAQAAKPLPFPPAAAPPAVPAPPGPAGAKPTVAPAPAAPPGSKPPAAPATAKPLPIPLTPATGGPPPAAPTAIKPPTAPKPLPGPAAPPAAGALPAAPARNPRPLRGRNGKRFGSPGAGGRGRGVDHRRRQRRQRLRLLLPAASNCRYPRCLKSLRRPRLRPQSRRALRPQDQRRQRRPIRLRCPLWRRSPAASAGCGPSPTAGDTSDSAVGCSASPSASAATACSSSSPAGASQTRSGGTVWETGIAAVS